MNILIAGASGFLGTELVNHFLQKHQLTVLGRSIKKLERYFPKSIAKLSWENLETKQANDYDIIINLSGANIGDKRWNESIKKELIESRTQTNLRLIQWISKQNAAPRFFCANAIGIYGAQKTSVQSFDEYSKLPPQAGNDFLQKISFAWEASLQSARDQRIPVTILRFGVVLKKHKGMLKKLEIPFKLGLGSILGDGEQVLSWIHYQDLINAIDFIIDRPHVIGAVNITSPHPITQKEFAVQLARSLKRPLLFRIPSWCIKALFGEMGESLLLKGQSVVPKRLMELGFDFVYPNIDAALNKEYQKE